MSEKGRWNQKRAVVLRQHHDDAHGQLVTIQVTECEAMGKGKGYQRIYTVPLKQWRAANPKED